MRSNNNIIHDFIFAIFGAVIIIFSILTNASWECGTLGGLILIASVILLLFVHYPEAQKNAGRLPVHIEKASKSERH